MTDQMTPASAGAQPIADANPIDSIIDNAIAETTQESPDAETIEPSEPVETVKDEPFPKKAINALSRRDKQIGKLKAQYEQAQAELDRLRVQAPQAKPATTGEPKETDFNNYADYMRAVQKYDLHQEIAKLNTKQQETQQTAQEQAWVSEREQHVVATAQAFIKENPEALAIVDEYSDVIDEFPPQIQRLFLEADNAALAVFNLAKEGKLESLGTMSLAKAAMEIGRAQTQVVTKPKTKAPIPLPASRGSVPSGKRPEDMNGKEIREWMRAE